MNAGRVGGSALLLLAGLTGCTATSPHVDDPEPPATSRCTSPERYDDFDQLVADSAVVAVVNIVAQDREPLGGGTSIMRSTLRVLETIDARGLATNLREDVPAAEALILVQAMSPYSDPALIPDAEVSHLMFLTPPARGADNEYCLTGGAAGLLTATAVPNNDGGTPVESWTWSHVVRPDSGSLPESVVPATLEGDAE